MEEEINIGPLAVTCEQTIMCSNFCLPCMCYDERRPAVTVFNGMAQWASFYSMQFRILGVYMVLIGLYVMGGVFLTGIWHKDIAVIDETSFKALVFMLYVLGWPGVLLYKVGTSIEL